MSLYDDDDFEPNKEGEGVKETTKKPGIDLKFLQTQLKARKAQLQNAPSIKFSAAPTPVMDLSRKRATPGSTPSLLKPIKAKPLDPLVGFSVVPQALKEDKVLLFNEYLCKDEYNPTAPNEYFAHKQKRDTRIAKEKIAKEIADRLHREHLEEEAKRKSGACFAPPPSLMETDMIEVKHEPALPPQPFKKEPPHPTFIPKGFVGSGHGLGVAASIMSKMGYKEGSGLGRTEQGMSKALIVERTGSKSGVIKSEMTETIKDVRARFEAKDEANAPSQASITEKLKSASKVILLRNMVSPPDVDPQEELEAEVKSEMSKYGQISTVVIHTMSEMSDDDAVRIFIEFTNQAQAIKAFIDLNGRFFAGRPIKVSFYSFDDFRDEYYEAPVSQ